MASPDRATFLEVDVDAVLFDMDGTLVDSTELVEDLWTSFSNTFGLPAAEVIAFSHGRPTRATLDRYLPAGADYARVLAGFEAAELERSDGITEVPGAKRLLDTLAGAPIAMVTSATRAVAARRVHAAGLEFPGVIVTSEDVSASKPDPAGYLHAARVLGVHPSRCLAFEDAEAGIQAAVAAGTTTVVVGAHRSPTTRGLPGVADLREVSATVLDHGAHVRVRWSARGR